MTRLRGDDRRRIQEIEDALLMLRLDRHAELERLLKEVRILLGVERTAVWGAVRERDGFRLVFSFGSGWHPGEPRPPGGRMTATEDMEQVAAKLRPWLPAGHEELRLLLSSTPRSPRSM